MNDMYANTSTRRAVSVLAATLTLLALGIAGSVTVAAAPETLTECSTIDTAGEYVLGTDIDGSGNTTCIEITSSDVILDGDGYSITGTDSLNSAGVHVDGSSGSSLGNVSVTDLTVTDWETGLYYDTSDDGTIRNVTATSNVEYGIHINEGTGHAIENSSFTDNNEAVYVFSSTTHTITNNTFTGSGTGVRMILVQQVTAQNNAFEVTGPAFDIQDTGDIRFGNNTIVDGGRSTISGSDGPRNQITNNSFSQSAGMEIDSAVDDLVANNTLTGGTAGVHIKSSEQIEFRNNSISDTSGTNSDDGLLVTEGSSHVIVDNNIENSDQSGIRLGTTQATLSGNTLSGNQYNLRVGDGGSWSSISHTIDASNTVEGRPVAYHVNETDVTVDPNAGWVGVIGTENATVADITFPENNHENVLVRYADNTTIRNVAANDPGDAIGQSIRIRDGSDYTRILNSTFEGAGVIQLHSAAHTRIENTLIDPEAPNALSLYESPDTVLENVTVSPQRSFSDGASGTAVDIELGSERLTVLNSTISNNDGRGINLARAHGSVIRDSVIQDNGGYGIRTENDITTATIAGNIISGNDGDGVFLDNRAQNNVITGNEITDNTANGIELDPDGENTTIRNNVLTGNNVGIDLPDPYDVLSVYDNRFNNSQNVLFADPAGVTNASWNTTATAGTNIVGGNTVGGNYWADQSGTGFSETCTDRGDGICEAEYTLDNGHVDYLPLATPPGPTVIQINKSGSGDYTTIQQGINNATDGDTVEVQPGTYTETVTVDTNITLVAPSGATLDGSSFGIDSTGIYVDRNVSTGLTIDGFTVESYGDGIGVGAAPEEGYEDEGEFVSGGRNGIVGGWTIQNVVVRDNAEDGIDIPSATDAAWTLTNVTATGNGDEGIEVGNSATPNVDWVIDGANASDNGASGILVSEGDGAWTIQHSVTNDNGDNGGSGVRVIISGSNWSVTDHTATGNDRSGINVPSGDAGLIERANLSENRQFGLEALTEGDWTLRDSLVLNNDEDGVYDSNTASSFLIENVTIRGNGHDGVFLLDNTGDWQILDSVIENNGETDSNDRPGAGIDAERTSGSWVVNNTSITGNDGAGIYAVDGPSPFGDATDNWWGQSSGPLSGQCQGNVSCSPYLSSEPGTTDGSTQTNTTVSKINLNTSEVFVENAVADIGVSIPLNDTDAGNATGVQYSGLNVTTTQDATYNLTVETNQNVFDSASALNTGDGLLYANISHPDLADSDIEKAVFNLTVNASELPQGAAIDDIALYRYGGDWTMLSTTQVSQSGEIYELRATSPGLSVFAVALTPDITVSPDEPDLGSVELGTTANETITITNDGSADLDVSGITLSGFHSDSFTEDGTAVTVGPGGSSEFNLTFTPTSTGPKDVDLVIESNDPDESSFFVFASGESIDTIDPVADININDTTPSVGESVSFDASGSTDENSISSHTWDFDDGTTATGIDATHAYTAAGTYLVELTVTDAAGNTNATTTSITVGETSQIAVSPTAVDFGTLEVGSSSTEPVTVANQGQVALSVTDVSITGTDASTFTETVDSFVLAPGDNRTVDVTFNPNSQRGKTADLSIESNDTAVIVALSGSARRSTSGGDGGDNNGRGGDSGSSNPPPASDTNTSVSPVNGSSQITVQNPQAGVPVDVVLPASDAANSTLTGISVTTNTDRDYTITVTNSDSRPSAASFVLGENRTAIVYVTVDHSVPDAEIDAVQFTFRVNKSRLAAASIDAGNLTLSREVNGTLVTLPTTQVGEDATHYVFEAESPGLSVFVVSGATTQAQPTDSGGDADTGGDTDSNTDGDPTTDLNNDSDEDDSSAADDSGPGFGVGAAVLAILVSALLARRWRE